MKKKVAIIGATGALGSILYKVLKDEYSLLLLYRDSAKLKLLENEYGGLKNHKIYKFDFEDFLNEYKTSRDRPERLFRMRKLIDLLSGYEKIVNCAGLLKDDSNKNPEMAFFANAAFPNILSSKLKEKLIHITTDCVFNGLTGAPYNENAAKTPNDIYGLSKSLGESSESLVLRTSFIGPELGSKNSFFEWVMSMRGGIIKGYSNHLWNGLTTKELAVACKKIMDGKSRFPKSGIFHLFSETLSKYEMALKLNHVYDLRIKINKTKSKPVDRRLSTVYKLNSLLKLKTFDDMLLDLHT